MSQPVQCKPLGCHGPVTHLSCFHCPVYRCYETALGAGAEGQTGSRAAPSRVYGAPRTLCRVVALPLFVQRNKLSLPRFTRGHSSSKQEEYVRMPPIFLPSDKAHQKRIFRRISIGCIFMCSAAIKNTEIRYITRQNDFLNF